MTADAVGGVWTYALDLAAALAAHDITVVLATMGPRPSGDQRSEALRIPGLGLYCHDAKLEWMQEPWNDVDAAGDWLLQLAREQAVDLVHLNGYAHATLDWHVPVLVAAHSCVFSWWQAVHGTLPHSGWATYRRRVGTGLRAAHCVVSPTAAFLAQLKSIYGVLPRNEVIHNARSTGHFSPAGTTPRLPLALSCGRAWDEAKNLRVLDEAAAHVAVPIYVAGSLGSPDGEACRFQTLRALGKLRPSDLAQWLTRASVYVHPAVYEPFGLSILEAAQSGCALLLADIPTLRELWADAALFCDSRDATAIASALQRLMEDAGLRDELGQAAQRRSEMFKPADTAAAYARLYRNLCDGAGARQAVA
jgi:glycosyltransferase involved in cell wall biosynthesis